MQLLRVLLFLLFTVSLSSCGGSGPPASAASSTTVVNNNLLQGRFIDSSVQGVRYSTPSIKGFSDETEGFLYYPNETISFYIGDILLGSTKASSLVTLNHLTSEKRGNDPIAVRLARFIQSVNEDGCISIV